MEQQRSARARATWAQRPVTWILLAVTFLAISTPQWVAALAGGEALSFVSAAAFTVAAVLFVLYARHAARGRTHR